jgi:hypothetical protein
MVRVLLQREKIHQWTSTSEQSLHPKIKTTWQQSPPNTPRSNHIAYPQPRRQVENAPVGPLVLDGVGLTALLIDRLRQETPKPPTRLDGRPSRAVASRPLLLPERLLRRVEVLPGDPPPRPARVHGAGAAATAAPTIPRRENEAAAGGRSEVHLVKRVGLGSRFLPCRG